MLCVWLPNWFGPVFQVLKTPMPTPTVLPIQPTRVLDISHTIIDTAWERPKPTYGPTSPGQQFDFFCFSKTISSKPHYFSINNIRLDNLWKVWFLLTANFSLFLQVFHGQISVWWSHLWRALIRQTRIERICCRAERTWFRILTRLKTSNPPTPRIHSLLQPR